ncbi:MAG TPA: tRNA (adenosine(37)-N6)-dimethylallyltransferase MiaA [Gemmatimonadaceae bacterium]|nr:tRNA (adenosine(37)-N6)-dimethylallyltransferase MiaA [Gemmatimonadaceae bacterium]
MGDAERRPAALRVICGPTGAGKSALAMALAERFPLAILSADSRQIYRGFDIGTAKPTAEERRRVPHFGIDVAHPAERYSAAAWAEGARCWVEEARSAGRTPVVVGGTGFYIRALVEPLFAEPHLDPAARRALERELAELATSELARRVRELDPARAHLGRTQLLRAIEVALLTGTPISEWHRRAARGGGVRARYLVVDPGAALRARIEARVHAMLDAGWMAETERLMAAVPEEAPAWNATGYATVRRHARGELSLDAAIERITIDTRQYAKRQRTWFRHQLPEAEVTRIDPTAPHAAESAAAWWEEGEDT